MKKQMKKLVLAKETVRDLGLESIRGVVGGFENYAQFEVKKDTDKTVCWSVVCTDSGMYTCCC